MATQSKPKEAPGIVQVKTVPFQGELPKRGGGFQRQPNAFDPIMSALTFDDEGKSAVMLTEIPHENPDELKPYVKLLRNAAEHLDPPKGLDVWIVDNGVAWQARPKRQRNVSAA